MTRRAWLRRLFPAVAEGWSFSRGIGSTFGAPLYNVWGATEVVGSLTFGLRPGSIVRVVKGAQIRLIDEKGAVAEGESRRTVDPRRKRLRRVLERSSSDSGKPEGWLVAYWRSDAARRGR